MYLLLIPFVSKPKAKNFTNAIAKYIIDNEWCVIQERVELLEWTQIRGKTKYWTCFDKHIIQLRKKILEDDTKTRKLFKRELNIINQYFLENLSTVLNHDKLITWSNPTWSDCDIRRSPYMIYGWKYNQLMFINFFKRKRKNKKLKVNFELRKTKIKKINLDKYFDLFPKNKAEFDSFNETLFLILNKDNIDYKLNIDDKDYNSIISRILDETYCVDIFDESEKDEKRVIALRNIFKNRMRKYKTDHIFWVLSIVMCEAAHIYPVSEIKKEEKTKWYKIADPNNWLYLPVWLHKMYDKHLIYFDENTWEINYVNDDLFRDINKVYRLDRWWSITQSIFNEDMKRYIKDYNRTILKM